MPKSKKEKTLTEEGESSGTEPKQTLKKTKSKPISRTKRAGLLFSVSRSEEAIRSRNKGRLAGDAPVFLAAVGQHLVEELLDEAYQVRKAEDDPKRTDKDGNLIPKKEPAKPRKLRIQPRHIRLALQNDQDMNRVMSQAFVLDTEFTTPMTMDYLKDVYHENEEKPKKKRKKPEKEEPETDDEEPKQKKQKKTSKKDKEEPKEPKKKSEPKKKGKPKKAKEQKKGKETKETNDLEEPKKKTTKKKVVSSK